MQNERKNMIFRSDCIGARERDSISFRLGSPWHPRYKRVTRTYLYVHIRHNIMRSDCVGTRGYTPLSYNRDKCCCTRTCPHYGRSRDAIRIVNKMGAYVYNLHAHDACTRRPLRVGQRTRNHNSILQRQYVPAPDNSSRKYRP